MPRTGRPPVPFEFRFWIKVQKSQEPKGCWLWTGAVHKLTGYGATATGGRKGAKSLLAHRVSYEMSIGPIPEGLQLDHLCRVRNCVNPEHLEPVTARENTMRSTSISALNAVKTHCVNGHPFSDDNTVILKSGWRDCLHCRRVNKRNSTMRKRAKKEGVS